MRGQIIRLTLAWILLFAIAGGEYVVSAIHMPLGLRPVLLVFAMGMIAVIAFVFMNLGRMPVVAQGFAVAAVFWLIVLFGLGMMDPLSRYLWGIHGYSPQ